MATRSFTPLICVVDFHHARGPEVEKWFGVTDGQQDPAQDNDWSLLPFLALSDGSHASVEDFSYFTLRWKAAAGNPPSSLFGISCTRHLDARELINKPADVTRSSVQKALVVVLDSPYLFARIREKLSAVTKAWFAQKDFSDFGIVQEFQENVVITCQNLNDERDQYFGMSLREMIHEYKWQTLVLFKCFLLQPKMIFFGSNCEKMCLLQFSLISLIPGLLRSLQDCADPSYNIYEEKMIIPSSLKTSERSSLLSYMGLPLQLFGKGSLFGPYTPLQGLDVLIDDETKSYIVGTTNSLLLSQKERYSDVFINLDDHTFTISSQPLKAALALSTSDRRWIDFLTQTVNDTWDDANPTRPNTLGYTGSEDFIRLQFEEYLLALVSSIKYRFFTEKHGNDPKALLSETYGDPANDFGPEWVQAWIKTDNFRIFNKFTDTHLFDIVEPRHPSAGALTIEDVQRRVAQQVAELHLDERFATSKEAIGKHLATGQQKVSTAFNNLWADIEAMREAQRRKAEERRVVADTVSSKESLQPSQPSSSYRKPDLSKAQANVQAASARAGAYLNSWGQWAADKRKTGWANRTASGSSAGTVPVVEGKERQGSVVSQVSFSSTTTSEGGANADAQGNR